jgi:hypothetical protein
MSINNNCNQLPVLKLTQHPVPDIEDNRNLFEKFTNPTNLKSLSLKTQGHLTIVFAKNQMRLDSDGPYPGTLAGNRVDFLSSVMDPENRLKSLIKQGKIVQIHGNSTVDQAQVLLLDDTCHPDKQQSLIRGEIANLLKGKENVFLGESYPSSKIVFNRQEIDRCFSPNLALNQMGVKDYMCGWDDAYVYKQSKASVIQTMQQINCLRDRKINFLRDRISTDSIETSIDDLSTWLSRIADSVDEVTGKQGHLRTEVLWHTIEEKHRLFPNAKMIVFGGSRHLKEKWLHEQLSDHQLRFVEITPIEVEAGSAVDTIEQANEYYQVDRYSIWGNKKQN